MSLPDNLHSIYSPDTAVFRFGQASRLLSCSEVRVTRV